MKMKTPPPTLIILLPVLLLVVIFSDPATAVRNASQYTHLQLVYTWSNTFCLNKTVTCKKPVPQNFALHGLWPADKTGKCLVHCSKTGNISWAVNKYEKQLSRSWSTLRKDMTNKQFWQYQWDKHGTCALPRIKVLDYLQLIIANRKRFDLLRALSASNIKPNGSLYPRKSVEVAIRQGIGGSNNFYVSCERFKGGVFIKEIYVCLDGYGHKVISCPSSNRSRGCGASKNLVFSAESSRI